MPRVPLGLTGPSSHASVYQQQSARTVNLYPEVNDADAKTVIALHSCPGRSLYVDISAYSGIIGEANIRGLHVDPNGRFWHVSGANFGEIVSASYGVGYGAMGTTSGRVCISDNADKIITGDGLQFLVHDPATPYSPTVVTDGVDPIQGTMNARMGPYTLYIPRDQTKFWYSSIGDPATVTGLSFASAERDPDLIVALKVLNDEVFFLGSQSLEIWALTGNTNVFEPIQGAWTQLGCPARWSPQIFDNSLVFVGQNRDGAGGVWQIRGAGAQPQKISTPAVDFAIADALANYNAESITSYTYEGYGHAFYVLNLPTITWALKAGLPPALGWHERGYWNTATGAFERLQQDHHAFWNGEHYVGLQSSAEIHKQSKAYYSDDGDPLVRFRECPHLTQQGRRFRADRLTFDVQTGVGIDGAGQGANPVMMVGVRWDGLAVENEVQVDLGPIGRTETEVTVGPVGQGRDLVVSVWVSDPVPVTFMEAYADVTVGTRVLR